MSLPEKIIIGFVLCCIAGAIWHEIGRKSRKPGRPTGGNLPPRENGQDEP